MKKEKGVKLIVSILVFVLIVVGGLHSARGDANIVVLNEDYSVKQGESLETLVTLTPPEGAKKIDAALKFEITDSSKKVISKKSERVIANSTQKIIRSFDTTDFQKGGYVISLEVTSNNSTASSSAHFSVTVTEPSEVLGKTVLFIFTIIVLVVLTVLGFLMVKKLKSRR